MSFKYYLKKLFLYVAVRTTFQMHRVLVIDIAKVQRMTLSGFYFETFLAFVMISLYHIVKCETVTGSHTASAVFNFARHQTVVTESLKKLLTFYSIHPILIDAAGGGGGLGRLSRVQGMMKRYCEEIVHSQYN